jgi:small subunit ribosomal protein S4
MSNYTGPKVRLSRKLGVPIAETSKHVNPRKQTRPGQHGFKRGRTTLYGTQLKEKQKIAYYYNVQNKQLRQYMKLAEQSRLTTDVAFQQILETRLDNVIRRLRWARTIWQARQIVGHGHVKLNGRRVDLPSIRVKVGDVLEIKERSKKYILDVIESTASMGFAVPEWLTADDKNLKATVIRLPEHDEVRLPFEVDFSNVIEFYTR